MRAEQSIDSGHLLPRQKVADKLIVVIAFNKNLNGDLGATFGPMEMPTEERAIRTAQGLASSYAGVVAWSRTADLAYGEYGPPTILYHRGDIPEME